MSQALLKLAEHADSRKCLMLVKLILDTPQLADRLFAVLTPGGRVLERRPYELGNVLSGLLFWSDFCRARFRFWPARCTCRIFMARMGTARAAEGGLGVNFGTIAAFLAWFGGTGFLLERYSRIWVYLALFISIVSGVAGAAVVFWFLAKLARRTGRWIRRITKWWECSAHHQPDSRGRDG